MLAYLCAWVRFRRSEGWASEVLASVELKDLLRAKLGNGLTSGFRTIIERAVERRELLSTTDVDLMATLPMALVHQHWLLTGRPADEALALRIADQFFRAADHASARRRGRTS